MNKWLIKLFIILITVIFPCVACFAQTAIDITKETEITSLQISVTKLLDNNIATHSNGEKAEIEISSATPMGGIYLKYNKAPAKGYLNNSTEIASSGFLHEFIPLDGSTHAKLSFESVDICDIFVYSVGEMPQSVQMWQTGDNKTDILLCATHSDDDQLFFAGLLPRYAILSDANVRVAYFINHFDTHNRTHELLDGLWHCGVKNYPDISPFPDGYSESAEGAEAYLSSKGYSYEDILDFQSELLDKYNPKVVVLHDINGEYGHGAHMLNTKSFLDVCSTGDETQYTPEKIYIHLYNQNQLYLDIDTPSDLLNGKTPFQISQEAFRYHKSQHWTWFYNWIYGKNSNITSSSQIKSYNPALYGLYSSRVGTDSDKGDILENVLTYKKEKELADEQEKQRKQEQQKILQQLLSEKQEKLSKAQLSENDASSTDNDKSVFRVSTPILLIFLLIIIITVTATVLTINKKKR